MADTGWEGAKVGLAEPIVGRPANTGVREPPPKAPERRPRTAARTATPHRPRAPGADRPTCLDIHDVRLRPNLPELDTSTA